MLRNWESKDRVSSALEDPTDQRANDEVCRAVMGSYPMVHKPHRVLSRSTCVSPSASAEEPHGGKALQLHKAIPTKTRHQHSLSHHLSLVLRSPQLRLPSGYEKMRAFSKYAQISPYTEKSPQTAAWDFSNTSLQQEMLELTACPWVILPHRHG